MKKIYNEFYSRFSSKKLNKKNNSPERDSNKAQETDDLNSKDRIKEVITKANKILIVGYSPTGGGHIGRTFKIIEQAFEDNHLAQGDVVVFHCPPSWMNTEPVQLNQIIRQLSEFKIQVILTCADKTIYGYLKEDGQSDDSKILERFAKYPLREANNNVNITDCGVLWNDQFGQNPSSYISSKKKAMLISAKDLMGSISNLLNKENEKIFVLTDMDPYLSKAAIQAGVPKKQCVDQQNHAILLDNEENSARTENSVLAKVLCGVGGKISHIHLGSKNTLSSVLNTATEIDIKEDTSKKSCKKIIIEKLILFGKRLPLSKEYLSESGVMFRDGLTPEEVENVVYVYAHKNTSFVGNHIRTEIANENHNYINKVFLFCGKDAVVEKNKNYNAIDLAYLCEADGITTAGAGMAGEFAYLHSMGRSQSRLLLLPISGHNEQQSNAKFLKKQYDTFVYVEEDKLEVKTRIDDLVRLPSPRTDGDMYCLLKALGLTESYQKQGSDILFSSAEDQLSLYFEKLEEIMYNDLWLKINRRYIKLVFQAFMHITNESVDSLRLSIKQGEFLEIGSLEKLVELFKDQETLVRILGRGSNAPIPQAQFTLYDKTIMLFSTFNQMPKGQQLEQLTQLKEEFGTTLTTGF